MSYTTNANTESASQTPFYPEKYEQRSYTLDFIIDYDNNRYYLEFNGVKVTISGWEEARITGLRFQTAGDAARSFDVTGIVISEIN